MKSIAYFLFLICLSGISCTKETVTTSVVTPSTDSTSILCDKSYGLTSLTIAINSNPSIEQIGVIPACNKDNFITYFSNGKSVENEGPTKCNPTDPQTDTSNWVFYSNKTKLIVNSDTADILILNATKLKLRTIIKRGSTTETRIITYTKK